MTAHKGRARYGHNQAIRRKATRERGAIQTFRGPRDDGARRHAFADGVNGLNGSHAENYSNCLRDFGMALRRLLGLRQAKRVAAAGRYLACSIHRCLGICRWFSTRGARYSEHGITKAWRYNPACLAYERTLVDSRCDSGLNIPAGAVCDKSGIAFCVCVSNLG